MPTTTTRFFRLPPLVLLALAALAASLMLAVVLARPAQAASLTVTTRHDELNHDGDCSLREAIEAANTNATVDGCAAGSATEGDTILFAAGQKGSITLDSELLVTDGAGLTIDGQKKITVSGGGVVRVFQVAEGAKLDLKKLTVSDGFADASSSFNDRGGGVNNNGGELKITRSTFSGNSSINSGGAVATQSIGDKGGTVIVKDSTFSGNSADSGGGMYILATTVTVTGSTFSGNSAGAGAGIFNSNFSTLTVTNSTFSGNSAGNNGGGITNGGAKLTIDSSTFAANSAFFGDSIFQFDNVNSATLKNTILADDPTTSSGNCAVPPGGPIIDGGYNIDNGSSCGFTKPSSKSSTDPLLGPLQDNGGPTQTMALQAGSPAIDKGNSFGATTDQRGLPRPVDFPDINNKGDGSDIGAYEVQP